MSETNLLESFEALQRSVEKLIAERDELRAKAASAVWWYAWPQEKTRGQIIAEKMIRCGGDGYSHVGFYQNGASAVRVRSPHGTKDQDLVKYLREVVAFAIDAEAK